MAKSRPTPVKLIPNEAVIPQLSADLQTLNLDDLLYLTRNQRNLIDFLQIHNLIAASFKCVLCGVEMNMKQKNTKDMFYWQCPKYSSCKTAYSIRYRSFFSGSKVRLKVLLIFLYLWAYKMSSYKTFKRECGMNSSCTIRDWKLLIRDICVEHFLRHPQIIGGKGCTVEIDESLFPIRTYTVGRIIQQMWVFGGYEESTKRGFLVIVPSRDSETLIVLIKKLIRPGTTIISGSWRAEDRLGLKGWQFLRSTHGCTFVDPKSLVVETLWQAAKKERDKIELGANGKMGNSYLAEFMWRQKFGNSPLENIFRQIAEIYPV